jgi:hypothetical protein
MGSAVASASEGGARIAHCAEVKDANQQYDFYEMKTPGEHSKFYLVLKDETDSFLTGPSDEMKFQDQGKTLGLKFPPLSFLIHEGQGTIGKVAYFGDVKDISCDAKW